MTSLNFQEYSEQNLPSLDRLVNLYVQQKNELMQRYWDELKTLAKKRIPQGFEFCCSTPKLIAVQGEHYFGWQTKKLIFGEQRNIQICVGVSFDPSRDFVKWQFMNQFWTGVQMGTNKIISSKISNYISSNSIDARQWERWVLYRDFDPIATSDLLPLFEKLKSQNRTSDQMEVIDQLVEWKRILDDVTAV